MRWESNRCLVDCIPAIDEPVIVFRRLNLRGEIQHLLVELTLQSILWKAIKLFNRLKLKWNENKSKL